MWKVYQWVWHRAQKSAAKEIMAMILVYFEEPYEPFRGSKDPAEAKHYALRFYSRQRALELYEAISQEYEVDRKPKRLDLLSMRDKINEQDQRVRERDQR